MESTETIDSLISEYKKYHKKYLTDMKVAVKKYFAEFFQLHPEIPQIVWTQYTPYWADGENTEFDTNFYNIFTDRDNDDESKMVTYTPEIAKLEQKVVKYLNSIPDEVFEYMFGDHVKVRATKKGFKIESYDHR